MQLIFSKLLSIVSSLTSIFFYKHKLGATNYKLNAIKRGVFLKNNIKKNIYVKISNAALNAVTFVTVTSNTINSKSSVVRFRAMDLTVKFYNWFSNVFNVQPTVYFLRKQKLFNKGRYSRNRQTYRTGAIWSLWVNILAVTGFYYWFYRFSMNFGYIWPFLSLFVLSFIVPRALKYNYFIFSNFLQSIIKLFVWFYLVFSSFFSAFQLNIRNFVGTHQVSASTHKLFSSLVLNHLLGYIYLILSAVFFISDRFDLFLKSYSHWNYFLPIGWIHRHHRSFFFTRIYHIIFSQKLHQ